MLLRAYSTVISPVGIHSMAAPARNRSASRTGGASGSSPLRRAYGIGHVSPIQTIRSRWSTALSGPPTSLPVVVASVSKDFPSTVASPNSSASSKTPPGRDAMTSHPQRYSFSGPGSRPSGPGFRPVYLPPTFAPLHRSSAPICTFAMCLVSDFHQLPQPHMHQHAPDLPHVQPTQLRQDRHSLYRSIICRHHAHCQWATPTRVQLSLRRSRGPSIARADRK